MALSTRQALHDLLHATHELIGALCRDLRYYMLVFGYGYQHKNCWWREDREIVLRDRRPDEKGKH